MKITKTSGVVLAVALVGATAWLFARNLPDSSPTKAVGSATATPGAALVELKLPATLSAQAATGKTYYDAIYEPSHHGDAAFLVAVRNGARQHHWSFGSMLPVQQKLTDGEIAAITLYVRELQRENGIM